MQLGMWYNAVSETAIVGKRVSFRNHIAMCKYHRKSSIYMLTSPLSRISLRFIRFQFLLEVTNNSFSASPLELIHCLNWTRIRISMDTFSCWLEHKTYSTHMLQMSLFNVTITFGNVLVSTLSQSVNGVQFLSRSWKHGTIVLTALSGRESISKFFYPWEIRCFSCRLSFFSWQQSRKYRYSLDMESLINPFSVFRKLSKSTCLRIK